MREQRISHDSKLALALAAGFAIMFRGCGLATSASNDAVDNTASVDSQQPTGDVPDAPSDAPAPPDAPDHPDAPAPPEVADGTTPLAEAPS